MKYSAALVFAILVLAARPSRAETIAADKVQLAPGGIQSPKLPGTIAIESVGQPTDSPPGIFKVGAGYNALTGEILPGICVTSNSPNLTFGQTQLEGTLGKSFIATVSDMASHASASSSDAGFNFTYKLVSVGFGTGTSSENYFNSVDQYARVYVRLATRGEAFVGETWSPLGKIEISNPLKRFTQICGTHYVRALYHGHILDQTYRFELDKTKYDKSNRNSFSLGIGKLFGFDYSDTTNQQEMSAISKLTVIDESRGILTVMPPAPSAATGVPTLVKFAREDFRKAVLAAVPSQASPVLIELVPYYHLPATGSGKVPTWPDEVMGMVSARTALYQNFLTAISDLNFAAKLASADAAQIYADAASIPAKQTTAIAIQKNYRDAVVKCGDLLKSDVDDAAARKACEMALDAALDPAKVQSIRLNVIWK
jgi:hypothetical protein